MTAAEEQWSEVDPKAAVPFVKYAGGKRKLAPKIISLMPAQFRAYHEPFVGGGAVFWALASEGLVLRGTRRYDWAFLSDSSTELMNVYEMIDTHVDALIQVLGWMQVTHETRRREYFEEVRRTGRTQCPHWALSDDVQAAARTIFLNKTGFNGLMRYNKKGEFNVPYGKYANPTICDAQNLLRCHRVLSKAVSVSVVDFEPSIANAKHSDVVYADPPYIPLSKTSSFAAYGKDGFGALEHARLARVLREAQGRGVKTILSNSDTPLTREIYSSCGVVHEVTASRSINSKGDKRGAVGELLIVG